MDDEIFIDQKRQKNGVVFREKVLDAYTLIFSEGKNPGDLDFDFLLLKPSYNGISEALGKLSLKKNELEASSEVIRCCVKHCIKRLSESKTDIRVRNALETLSTIVKVIHKQHNYSPEECTIWLCEFESIETQLEHLYACIHRILLYKYPKTTQVEALRLLVTFTGAFNKSFHSNIFVEYMFSNNTHKTLIQFIEGNTLTGNLATYTLIATIALSHYRRFDMNNPQRELLSKIKRSKFIGQFNRTLVSIAREARYKILSPSKLKETLVAEPETSDSLQDMYSTIWQTLDSVTGYLANWMPASFSTSYLRISSEEYVKALAVVLNCTWISRWNKAYLVQSADLVKISESERESHPNRAVSPSICPHYMKEILSMLDLLFKATDHTTNRVKLLLRICLIQLRIWSEDVGYLIILHDNSKNIDWSIEIIRKTPQVFKFARTKKKHSLIRPLMDFLIQFLSRKVGDFCTCEDVVLSSIDLTIAVFYRFFSFQNKLKEQLHLENEYLALATVLVALFENAITKEFKDPYARFEILTNSALLLRAIASYEDEVFQKKQFLEKFHQLLSKSALILAQSLAQASNFVEYTEDLRGHLCHLQRFARDAANPKQLLEDSLINDDEKAVSSTLVLGTTFSKFRFSDKQEVGFINHLLTNLVNI